MNDNDLNPLVQLRERLAAKPTEVGELPDWLGLAARAAVLGDRASLDDQAPEFFTEFKVDQDIKSWVLDRAKEGVWDFEHAQGEFLAYALIDAQDWHFLTCLEPAPRWLTPLVASIIRGWGASSRGVALDVEAVQIVEAYRDKYRIDEELLLPFVAAPLSQQEEIMFKRLANHLREMRQQRSEEPLVESSQVVRMAADKDLPPQTMRWRSPEMGFYCDADLIHTENRVVLTFMHIDGSHANLLQGLTGKLASFPFDVDERGSVSIGGDVAALPLRVTMNPALEIGLNRWHLIQDPE